MGVMKMNKQVIYNQLARCIKSLDDFHESDTYLTLCLSTDSGHTRIAAEIALIISYTRPFSGNQESIKGVPSSLPGKLLKTLNSTEFTLHSVILKEYRNKLVAHSELSHINPQTTISQNGAHLSTGYKQTRCLLTNADLFILNKIISKIRKETINYSSILKDRLPDGNYEVNNAYKKSS